MDFVHFNDYFMGDCEKMTQPTKDQLIAARDALANGVLDIRLTHNEICRKTVGMIFGNKEECICGYFGYKKEEIKCTIRTLLDRAINAPDLESLKREVFDAVKEDLIAGETIEGLGDVGLVIDHLAPRIVREGCVVVDAIEYQQLKNIQNALQANINMIAAAKGE